MRSRKAIKRILTPDPLYGSRLLHRFINNVMISGKKTLASNLVYKAFDEIKEKSKQDPLKIFELALENVAPKMEVRPRRVGGASYMVPVEVKGDRKEALAIRWILSGADAKPNKEFHGFDKKLAAEIMDAANNTGMAIKKKEDIQKQANANRAFAHFRW